MTEQEAREWAAKVSEQESRYWRQLYQDHGEDKFFQWGAQAGGFATRLRTGSTLVPIGEHRIEAGVAMSEGQRGTIPDAVILAQILTERERQRIRYSRQHDAEHDGAQWVALLAVRLGLVAGAEMGGGPLAYERALIQLAAVAMAALEVEQARGRL